METSGNAFRAITIPLEVNNCTNLESKWSSILNMKWMLAEISVEIDRKSPKRSNMNILSNVDGQITILEYLYRNIAVKKL